MFCAKEYRISAQQEGIGMKETLHELLIEEIRDLYDAEKQLVRALPKMAKSASDDELESAFREHLQQTKAQVERLEEVFGLLDMRPRSKSCFGMKGIVLEGEELMQENLSERLLDSAILGAGRKVEHYEMAGYQTASSLAQQLGMKDAVQLLKQTLEEEIETDRKLSRISKRLIKESARTQPSAGEPEPIQQRPRRNSRAAAKSSRGRTARTRSESRAPARRTRASAKAGSRSQRSSGGARMTTDHDEIRRWAEERGATPACVRGTGGRGDTGMIRLDFPGYSGRESLQPVSWDDWFNKFEDKNLGLLVQDTIRGQKSNFNKLVSRGRAAARPRARAAR